MTTQEIATRQNGIAPYIEPEIEEGDFGIADSELRAPFLAYSGKTGEFTDPISGEISQAVRLVLLRRLPSSRIRWNPNLDAPQGEAVQCRSLDMLYPVDLEQARVIGAGPTCAECKYSQFGTDANGKTTKSGCSEYLNLAVAHADDDEPLPYVVGVKSTGIKPVRKLLQQLSWLRVAKKAKKIPGYSLVFQLERGPLTGEGAKKYFPLAGRVLSEMVPEDRWPGLSALWHVVSQATIDTTAEVVDDEAEPATDDTPGPHVETGDELLARMDAEERASQEMAPQQPESSAAHPLPSRPATEPQIKAIYAIARGSALQLSDSDVEDICRQRFGCLPQELSRADAARLIDMLKPGASPPATGPQWPAADVALGEQAPSAQTLFDSPPPHIDPADVRRTPGKR